MVKIAFDNDLTDKEIVSARYSNLPLETLLYDLLKNTKLDFRIQADVVIIFPSPDKTVNAENVLHEVIKTVCMIKGFVKDKTSGESLPFAAVYIPSTGVGTMANSDGYFKLITQTCDTTIITVSYLGYKPVNYQVTPGENPQPFTFSLFSEPEVIEEIEVKYETVLFENNRKEDPSCTKLNLTRIGDIPSLSELDIVAPLQMMPGIDGSTETSSGLNIRKSPPDKNLIVYDGFTIYHIDHLFGSFSALNSKLIKDIKLYKTISDARQGGRTSGLVEITGKSGNMYKPSFELGADMLGIDGKIEFPVVREKISFVAAARRSYTDVYQTSLYTGLFRNIRYDYTQYYERVPFTFRNSPDDPEYMFFDIGGKINMETCSESGCKFELFSGI
ncbi:MAG: TonB-dependent receptor plug domain-containing protein [Bacteroidales bacterium]|nr:TonB-dependent receptor plug domain-containing protein [Bacteroidales bacterium]